MTSPLLTKSEAAERARISLRSLNNRLKDGTGPAVTRIGGKVLISEASLAEWLERCADGSPNWLAESVAA